MQTFEDLKKSLPYTECRFAIFDHDIVTADGRKTSKLWFISWLPTNSTPHHKMAYTVRLVDILSILLLLWHNLLCSLRKEKLETSFLVCSISKLHLSKKLISHWDSRKKKRRKKILISKLLLNFFESIGPSKRPPCTSVSVFCTVVHINTCHKVSSALLPMLFGEHPK